MRKNCSAKEPAPRLQKSELQRLKPASFRYVDVVAKATTHKDSRVPQNLKALNHVYLLFDLPAVFFFAAGFAAFRPPRTRATVWPISAGLCTV